eukprot:gene7048-7794_t
MSDIEASIEEGGSSSAPEIGWTRYFDSTHSAYYWYNHSTGESQWDDYDNHPEQESGEENDTASIEMVNLIQEHQQREEVAESSMEEEDLSPMDSDTRAYCIFIWINIVLVEGPLCVLEGIVRAVVLSVVALLVAVMASCRLLPRSRAWKIEVTIAKDILLTIAAATTLLIPGSIIFIYRKMSFQTSWSLCPLPTFLGAVDCRRFSTVTVFGAGSSAKEAARPSLDGMQDATFCYPAQLLHTLRNLG